MGIPEQYDHPEFIKTVNLIIEKARKHTLGVGIHFSLDAERQLFWIRQGVNIVIHSSDMALFSQRLKADMAMLKSIDINQQNNEEEPLLSPYNLNLTNHRNANDSPIDLKPDCLPAP
jgi:hypothetical protein